MKTIDHNALRFHCIIASRRMNVSMHCPTCGGSFDIESATTIALRLRVVLGSQGMTVREFSRRLTAKGTSYANLRRYLDDAEPVPSLLVEMAEILCVRVEWLTYGSGKVR